MFRSAMSLHQVDKLVREGRYREAMKALHKARDLEPSNPYITAYEERLRGLLAGLEAKAGIHGCELPLSARIGAVGDVAVDQDLPTVEQQMNAIAVPLGSDGAKRVAILGKVASLLRSANEYLNEGQYDRALEELWRANLLDPENREIDILDAKIRAAKAEAKEREEQERARQAVAENQERERRLQEERDRVQREQEEQRLKEEEAKKAAQVERVQQCITHARSLFLSGMLDDAQQELSFAMVLDPQNVQAHALQGEITRRTELIRRAEEERRRREEEERRRQEEERRRKQEELRRQEEELRRQEEELRARIADAIARATEARNRKDFNEALRIVTQTYLLDPSNDALQACENSIVAAHEEWMYQQEEERRKREAELRKQQEEERRQREQEERQTLLREKRAAEEARQRSVERETREHLSRAMELLNTEEFDEALAEVARAFAINPFKQEVKEVEELVLKAQEASRLLANLEQPAGREESPLVDEPLDEPGDQLDTPIGRKESAFPAESVAASAQGRDEAILSQIAAHVAAANFSTSQGDFARAFDEIAKAYALDAENPAIADCETSVQDSFLRYLQALSAAAPAPQPPEQSQLDFSETAAAFNAPMGEPVPGTIPGDVVEQRRVVLLRKEVARGTPWRSFPRKRMGLVVGGLAIVAALYAGVSGSSQRGSEESPGATAGPTADIVSPPTRQTEQSKFVLQASTPVEERSRFPEAKGKSPATKASERKEAAAGRPLSLTDGLRPATTSHPEPMLTGTMGEKEDQSTGTPFGDELVPTRMETSSPSARMPDAPPGIRQQTPGQKFPTIIRLERPRIPPAAIEIRAEGEVVVRVEVSAEGRPLSASIVRSSSPIYNDAVVEAVMHSEYSPNVPPNGASSSWITIPFKFTQ